MLVIDMQRGDVLPDGSFSRLARARGIELGQYFEEVSHIIPRIGRLQQACRAAGVEVIHIKGECRTRDCRDSGATHRVAGIAHPRGSDEAEIIEELQPVGDEIVMTKTSTGAFNSTSLDQTLRDLGIRSLIATGVVTTGCVELTVRDAADRGYRVIVVSDCCAPWTRGLHRDALQRIAGGLIAVKASAEVLRMVSAMQRNS